ncbi:MAG: hypothetical protein ACRCR6_05770, partial [Plesiomonas sp.]
MADVPLECPWLIQPVCLLAHVKDKKIKGINVGFIPFCFYCPFYYSQLNYYRHGTSIAHRYNVRSV